MAITTNVNHLLSKTLLVAGLLDILKVVERRIRLCIDVVSPPFISKIEDGYGLVLKVACFNKKAERLPINEGFCTTYQRLEVDRREINRTRLLAPISIGMLLV